MDADTVPDLAGDLVLLVQACSAALGDSTLARVRAQVGDDLRFHDGYVFQHLLVGPRTVSQLARDLGVTQQAASKQVADLLERRLVTKRRSPDDGRAWEVCLSERGRRAVEAARQARAELRDEVATALGPAGLDDLLDRLRDLSDHLGALDELASRRLRPEPVR